MVDLMIKMKIKYLFCYSFVTSWRNGTRWCVKLSIILLQKEEYKIHLVLYGINREIFYTISDDDNA
jgi:hypothetical protein